MLRIRVTCTSAQDTSTRMAVDQPMNDMAYAMRQLSVQSEIENDEDAMVVSVCAHARRIDCTDCRIAVRHDRSDAFCRE